MGVHISENLTWSLNTTQLLKRDKQWLYFWRRLINFGMSPEILSNFYSCIVESILTSQYGSITAMDANTCTEWQRLLRRWPGLHCPLCRASTTAESTGELPPSSKDSTHPPHGLTHFYRSVESKNTTLKNSFFLTAIRLIDCLCKFTMFYRK